MFGRPLVDQSGNPVSIPPELEARLTAETLGWCFPHSFAHGFLTTAPMTVEDRATMQAAVAAGQAECPTCARGIAALSTTPILEPA